MPNDQEFIVDIQNLSRSFDKQMALQDVSLQVPRGQVLGIVGENGAGKTTLIKHILGLYRAQQGSVSVFGMDPVKQPKDVLLRIGYLSEQPDLPQWMTVSQFINYTAAFYPNWDHAYAAKLLAMVDLDKGKKVRELSKGQQARLALCVAQAHRPELLLLDEPSSGLDPIARKDILSAIIHTVIDEGRSVILSSHLLEEVERVCDHLVMFRQGQILMSEPMDTVLTKHYQISARTNNWQDWQKIPEILKATQVDNEWQLLCFGEINHLNGELRQKGVEILDHRLLSLDETFIARTPDIKTFDEVA